MFLNYHFEVSTSIDSFIEGVDHDKILLLPLKILSKVVLAFFESQNGAFRSWFSKHKSDFLAKYKNELGVEKVSEDGDTIKIEYLIDIVNEPNGRVEAPTAHDENIGKLKILRELVPDKEVYASDGYGQIVISDFQPDDLHKTIKKAYLLPQYLPEINSTFCGIAEYLERLDDWRDYYKSIYAQRSNLIGMLENIIEHLKLHFSKKKISDPNFTCEIDEELLQAEREVSHNLLLPKVAVDKFGKMREVKEKSSYVDEDNHLQLTPNKEEFTKFEFDGEYRNYLNYLKYFLQKTRKILLNSIIRKGDRKVFDLERVTNLIPDAELDVKHLSMMNLKDAYRHLIKYQERFKKLFSQFIGTGIDGNYYELEAKEIKTFNLLLPMWYNFAYFPGKTISIAPWMKENYVSQFLSDQLKKIRNSIVNNCGSNISIKNCVETTINEERSTVFQIDSKVISNLDILLRKIEKLLFKYFKDLSVTSLSFYIMDTLRKQFVFLFTCKNKIMEESVFIINLYDLKDQQSIFENIHLRTIPLDQLAGEKLFFNDLSWFADDFKTLSTKTISEVMHSALLLEQFGKFLEFPFDEEVTSYNKINRALEEIGKKFKDVFSLLDELEEKYKEYAIEFPQSLIEFRKYFSSRQTEKGEKNFSITTDEFYEVISLSFELINGISESTSIYLKEVL